MAEVKAERYSELKIVGIDQDLHIRDEAPIIKFVPNTEMTISMYLEKIQKLYRSVSATILEKRMPSNLWNPLYEPVEIGGNDRELLQLYAEKNEIHIQEDFFELGNLSREAFHLDNAFSRNRESLIGTEVEKVKYGNIKKLSRCISEALIWAPVENAFTDKKCLKLALQSSGTIIDEDIDIVLVIPKKSLLTRSEFPKFDNAEMKYLLDDCDMSEIFGISSTPTYSDYGVSVKTSQRFPPRVRMQILPFGAPPSYRDEFEEQLDSVFFYSCYDEGDKFAVKLKFDYIKHNTTIAFPSIIFIKEPFDAVPYTITSKNSPKIVSGEIKISDNT